MIHYHGTPIGGSDKDAATVLIGRHALVPFPYQDHMGIVADACQTFILDNGAFTAWKKGKEIDYEKYLSFVEKWCKHPGYDWALIPDLIEGSEEENDAMLDMWETKAKGVPVWHLHESIGRLKKLCDKYEIVALGSSGEWPNPNTKKWWVRMTEVLDAICDDQGRPPCKLHGLRMLDKDVFTKIPLSSADSTNAGRANDLLSRYGLYVPPSPGARSRVVAERIEVHTSAPIWNKSALQIELF